MAVPITLTLAWFIASLFYFAPKRLNLQQGLIVLALLAFITRSVKAILSLNLHYTETTVNPFIYISFLVQREVTIPLVIMLFANTCLLSHSWLKNTLLFILFLGIILSLDYLSVYLGVESFRRWNYSYSLLTDAGYLAAGLLISRLVLLLPGKEPTDDHRL